MTQCYDNIFNVTVHESSHFVVFVVEMEAGIEDDHVGFGATQVIELGCGDQRLE